MKYHIITFGCQLNLSDSERIASLFEQNIKAKRAKAENKADFVIINMCSVRQSAVNRVYGLAEKFKKFKKKPTTILTGCVTEKDIKKFSKIFNFVLNINDLPNWPELLGLNNKISEFDNYLCIESNYLNKFSANVPIMTGCNNFCSYCVVPYTRGREVSRNYRDIIKEIKKLVENGSKEIWLLGQNVNSYKSGDINFPKLFEMIDNISGDFWIRFTSSHPKDFSDELIKVLANAKKYPKYLNLPVQSGSNKILCAMNRPYTREKYIALVKKIRKVMPNIAISTDIIVGFPGETKTEFKESEKLFREVGFDMAYINKYSSRPGTASERMKDNISQIEKSKRERALNEILKKTALKNNLALIGKEDIALIDKKGKRKDEWFGKTTGYKTIKIVSKENLFGKFLKIKIEKATSWGLSGKLVK